MGLFKRDKSAGPDGAPSQPRELPTPTPTVADIGGGRIEVRSPLNRKRLETLAPVAKVVQASTALTDQEHQWLGGWFARHPEVEFRMYANYRRTVRDLSFLRHYPLLESFSVDCMDGTDQPALTDVDALLALPLGLKHLSIGIQLPAGFSLDPLRRLQVLESVSLARQKTLPAFLAALPKLQTLYVEGPIRSIEPLAELRGLEDLTLRSVTAPDLRPLTQLHQLRSLDLKLGGIKDLSLLPAVGKLRYLELWMIRGLSDVSAIGELPQLEKLFLQALKQVVALPDLSACARLKTVHLETMKGLTDLRPLATAPALAELWLVDAGHLQPEVLQPFVGHPTLSSARLGFGSTSKNTRAKAILGLPDAVR